MDWQTFASVGFVVLVPLVPAVILYKFFEQKTIVTGPFKGLRLDLSGAFAGYFLVLLICSGLLFEFGNYQGKIENLNKTLQEKSELGTPWTVQFQVKLKTRDGRDDPRSDQVFISIEPAPHDLGDGVFEVHVLKEKQGDLSVFPKLQVSRSGYLPAVVYLEPSNKLGKQYSKDISERDRSITITQPVELREAPPGIAGPGQP